MRFHPRHSDTVVLLWLTALGPWRGPIPGRREELNSSKCSVGPVLWGEVVLPALHLPRWWGWGHILLPVCSWEWTESQSVSVPVSVTLSLTRVYTRRKWRTGVDTCTHVDTWPWCWPTSQLWGEQTSNLLEIAWSAQPFSRTTCYVLVTPSLIRSCLSPPASSSPSLSVSLVCTGM